jgi:uncharacterized OB-fold protein
MGLPHWEPPSDDGLAAPFWTAMNEERLVLPRCSVCGRWQWYPDDVGADCPGAELQWEPVSTSGTIHTMTRVERAFLPGGQNDVPFTVIFVELDGVDGPRLVANLAEDTEARIGDRVVATFPREGDRRRLLFVEESSSAAAAALRLPPTR